MRLERSRASGLAFLLAIAPTTAGAAGEDTIDILYERAVSAAQGGRSATAAAIFEEVLLKMPAEHPLRPLAIYGAARANQKLGTPKAACRAVEHFKTFIGLPNAEPEKRAKAASSLEDLVVKCDKGSVNTYSADESERAPVRDEVDETEDDAADNEPPSADTGLRLGLSVGTGAGTLTDKAEAQNRPGANLQPGAAFAPFHALVELDYWFLPGFGAGLFSRLQVLTFAHLEGLRFKARVLTSKANHLVARAGFGFGYVSHVVSLDGYRDNTLEGPYALSLGLTWVHDFDRTWAFVLTPEFTSLRGTSPSLHVDLNAGLQISF